MTDAGSYGRHMGESAFALPVAPVDPSRIQALLAQACSNVTHSASSFASKPEGAHDALDALIVRMRCRSPEPGMSAALSGGIYDSLLEYVGRGGPLPSVGGSSTGTSVLVFVDGLDFNYQLTEEDLVKVFSRFGSIGNVTLSPDGTNAVVTLGSQFQADRAVSELNGKFLSGFASGSLRVIPYSWGSSSAPPTPLIRKYTCRFDIQIENDKEFHVARRIIGQKGSNMKRIVKQAGFDAKLRLRGRGSGFLEGAQKQESQEPLHLCVSCKDYQGYRSAVDQVEELLGAIYTDFREYCLMKGQAYPEHLRVVMHEHPLLFQSNGGGGGSFIDPPVLSPPLTPMTAEPALEASLEIEQLIEARNEARRMCNFKEADRIRDILRSRGIGLMDEPGGRGRGTDVTTWRFWR